MSALLVTGGAGYVGCVLVPKLIRQGFDVRVLDLMMFGSSGLSAVRKQCDIIEGDVRDTHCLTRALAGVDTVIHLAAISNDSSGDLDPTLTRQVNVDATRRLALLAKDSGVRTFVFASSSSVYGIKTELDVTEDLPLEPLTSYSKSKAWSEAFLRHEATPGFSTVSVRSATVCGYSPRQRLDTVANIFTSDARTKGRIEVHGGEQQRPLIHIDDIADCYLHMLKCPREIVSGQVFNVGSGNYALMQIAEIVRDAVGRHVEIVRGPRSSDSRSYRISSAKIATTLGFSARRTLQEAIQDLLAAFQDGRLTNASATIHRNIARMKEIGIEKLL